MERAIERGNTWLSEFKQKSHEEHIEFLAQSLYRAIELDPYGFPNGRPDWTELPEIDTNYAHRIDKFRYRNAALEAYKIFQYTLPDK